MARTWKSHKPWKEYPLRTCSYLNECAICKKPILSGEQYYDGGYNLRVHKTCVDIEEAWVKDWVQRQKHLKNRED